MKVSVIIPSYKPQDYLWECLKSLHTQTMNHDDFEILLVLNGCSEPYSSQIRNYIASDMNGTNIRFIQTDEAGVSNARNIGLDNAIGDYITFIDDDDYVSPSYLQDLYSVASPSIISRSDAVAFTVDDAGNKIFDWTYVEHSSFKKTSYAGIQPYCNAHCFAGSCMKLIYRDIIGDRRYDPRFSNGEDTLFMFLLSDRFQYVKSASDSAIYYRYRRAGSAFRTYTFKKRLPNCIKRIAEYTRIYLSGIGRYSFKFYFRIVAGAVKTIFIH